MTRPPQKVVAPFTAAQVDSLNGYQATGHFHPFTCGDSDCRATLEATPDGWQCPACDYCQDWAWDWMADGSWREWE